MIPAGDDAERSDEEERRMIPAGDPIKLLAPHHPNVVQRLIFGGSYSPTVARHLVLNELRDRGQVWLAMRGLFGVALT